jgi:hypothetical protein
MIADAREIAAGTWLRADLCIVGAGAAGIGRARARGESGRDVIVLGIGGDPPHPPTHHQ